MCHIGALQLEVHFKSGASTDAPDAPAQMPLDFVYMWSTLRTWLSCNWVFVSRACAFSTMHMPQSSTLLESTQTHGMRPAHQVSTRETMVIRQPLRQYLYMWNMHTHVNLQCSSLQLVNYNHTMVVQHQQTKGSE